MNTHNPIDTARTLVAGDKGLLAMDESNPACNERSARLGISQTEEAWRAYRESAAQHTLVHRARCNRTAQRSEYNAAMEIKLGHENKETYHLRLQEF
jgi:hypothetical protein